jgi:hypothetical protein
LITFHKLLAGCEAGDREAWGAFLAQYTPVVFQLLGVSVARTPEKRLELWRGLLSTLSTGNFERLRAFSHHSEREFLVDLREALLAQAVPHADRSQDAKSPPSPTVDTLEAILKGLPLIHQEIVFLTLAGYSQATLEKMLRITPSVAQSGLGRLQADYALVLERSEDRCLWPAAWLEITHGARGAKQQDCTPLRLLIRILDGQASWYDKNPVEEHRSACLHCLELWASLVEVVFWEREAKPWPAEKVESLLAALPLEAPRPSKRSFMARMFQRQ